MHYLSLLAALSLPLSVIAALCDAQSRPVFASAWYEGWKGDIITPDSLNYDKLNLVTFSFATLSSDTSQIDLDPVSAAALPKVVEAAHSKGSLVSLSIGGFSGCRFFSTAVSDANRTTFVKAVTALVDQYGVDGVEIDWEFPNKQTSCNTISANDSANFLSFLQELRLSLGNKTLMSAAVGVVTWNDAQQNPLSDVTGYAKVLDYVSIMTYDMYGAWSSTAGPNSPMNDTCAPPADQVGSVASAVGNWINAGFPPSKIVLGVASYGHSFFVTTSNAFVPGTKKIALFPPADQSKQPLGDGDSTTPSVDQCGNPVTPGGVLAFSSLVAQNYLTTDGTPADGIDSIFDQCSETPFLYKSSTQVMVAYDNPESFGIKGSYIVDKGLKGFSMWYAGGDSNDMLLDAISLGMGIKSC